MKYKAILNYDKALKIKIIKKFRLLYEILYSSDQNQSMLTESSELNSFTSKNKIQKSYQCISVKSIMHFNVNVIMLQ